jgi:hypothetical protein
MSEKIVTQFAVRDMKIMEDTLNKLNYSFSKSKDSLSIRRPYHNIIVTADKVSCDSVNVSEVEKIKAEYSRNVYIDQFETEGLMYEVEETANEIIILA